jgi:hypothetical protein
MTPEAPIAAGWHLTPDEKAERYYNGMTWTDSYRTPEAKATAADGSPTGVVTVGYVMAVLFPIIGVIVGLVLLGNANPANKKHGGWVVLASVVAFVVWVAILTSASGGSDYSSY